MILGLKALESVIRPKGSVQAMPMEKESALDDAVTGVLTPALEALGYRLVLVRRTSGGRYATLHIMAERQDGKLMTVQDCVAISQEANRKLDGDGPLLRHCTLEVSAPGKDRPLVRVEDFERFTGHMACVELKGAKGATRRFQGRIARLTRQDKETKVELITASGPVKLHWRKITGARLFPSVERDSETGPKN